MHLPVKDFKQKIQQSVLDNRVVVISADTGAGKSTQVPQFLLELGWKLVITQPRRLAAVSLAKRVAEEMSVTLGELVGFRTGYEHCDSDKTRCLFVTDGLEMVRELHQTSRPDVLIIDEVHEWNLNIEMLVAWAKREKIKVVLMSATIESDKLLEYLGEGVLIKIPGQLFPIVDIIAKHSKPSHEIAELVKKQRNILVFLSGKSEIFKMQKELEELKVSARILPLHGELTLDEQKKVFSKVSMPTVILATNIAQTSLTIDYIDAVVDMGEEKRIETIDGIESLIIGRISKADEIQRKGRAGRCKQGMYLNLYSHTQKQLDFPVPEIQRCRLDQLCLRFKIAGFDARTIEFFHQPSRTDIKEAMRALHIIGAIDKSENVTALGKEISKIPISVHLAAMIIAAKKYRVLNEVLTIAACMEVKGILTKDANIPSLSSARNSDLLVLLDVYNKALKMSDSQIKLNGIHQKGFSRAKELRQKMLETLNRDAKDKNEKLDLVPSNNKQNIVKACLAGMIDHVYQTEDGGCRDADDQYRSIDKRSVVSARNKKWIVGLPLNLEIPTKFGGKKLLKLVTMVSEITPEMLREIAPQVATVKREVVRYDELTNTLRYQEVVSINGRETRDWVSRQPDWEELDQYLPKGTDKEQLRLDSIDAIFNSCKKVYPFTLQESYLGIDQVYQNNHEPKQYGLDLKTKEPLLAYPGVVKRKNGYYLQYFKTKEEAMESDKLYLSVSHSPFANLAKLKI